MIRGDLVNSTSNEVLGDEKKNQLQNASHHYIQYYMFQNAIYKMTREIAIQLDLFRFYTDSLSVKVSQNNRVPHVQMSTLTQPLIGNGVRSWQNLSMHQGGKCYMGVKLID